MRSAFYSRRNHPPNRNCLGITVCCFTVQQEWEVGVIVARHPNYIRSIAPHSLLVGVIWQCRHMNVSASLVVYSHKHFCLDFLPLLFNLQIKWAWKKRLLMRETLAKCQKQDYSWEQTLVYQLGVIDLAGRSVCSQQTGSLDESVHNWGYGRSVFVFGCKFSTLTQMAAYGHDWSDECFYMVFCTLPGGHTSKGDVICGFKITGILAGFTQCLSISFPAFLSP